MKKARTSTALPGLVAEQQRMFAARKKTQAKLPGRITNANSSKNYMGDGYDAGAMRPGANDFLAVPIRMGDTLRYRDGRRVQL